MNYQTMPLSQIATEMPDAIHILRKYHLDFCCGGKQTLSEALAESTSSCDDVIHELENCKHSEERNPANMETRDLIEYITTRYHEKHRNDLPLLISLASKVETVHDGNPDCPKGLTAHLESMKGAMFDHMASEETGLFPALLSGNSDTMADAVAELSDEHDDLGSKLAELEALVNGFAVPEGACTTWVALLNGIRQLVDETMEHVHVENNILFPRALQTSTIGGK
jgi:regulator of cell morphogenesis and NO signaling